ncbi:MAG: alpha/beta fold hydrolase [Actinobacteria bacterium]|nr:alpha/beta fold hydrolase [Actinomycetota bacterium]
MRIGVLGPLRVEGVAATVALAAKERSLLAALALRAGEVVSTEALIRALWGDDPPGSARKTMQTYISNVRQVIGAAMISTHSTGYLLTVDPDDVDVHRFRLLVRAGDDALRVGDVASARSHLRGALALWRGDAFADVASHTGLAAEGVRLQEERLSALESRIDADLAAGAHAGLVGELEALVRDHPYRERLWGNLMVALYRCGRQADALATFRRARSQLVEELGIEPGGELRRIEAAILEQAPSLATPTHDDPPAAAGTPGAILRSPVRYVTSSGGASIAYQIAGDGPVDILAVPGFVTHLDIWWNAPTDGLVRRLASLGRLIAFDKRGMGLSDRPDAITPLDWVDDAVAVLDAVEGREVVVLGISAGTPTAIRLASLHPERVRALVVFGGGARTLNGPGYGVGHDRPTLEAFADNLERRWGTGVAISAYAPSLAGQPHVREYWARYQLLSASPKAAIRSFWNAVEDDVIDLLPTIDVPTLVLHPERDVIAPVSWGRFLAERIAGAEFVGLDSDVDLICVSDVLPDVAAEIATFLERAVPESTERSMDAQLVTIVAVYTASDSVRAMVESALARAGGRVQERPAHTAVFDAPGQAVRAVRALRQELATTAVSVPPVGVALHVGECVRSDIGFRGEAVELAHRLAVRASATSEVLVTDTIRPLLRAGEVRLEERPDLDAFLSRLAIHALVD